mmetsp:Transcript_27632/g.79762  ORF Transcript_27632/g.79762 Transcript_27632/m.79762 type:complete len:354 (+) Transcript_27632:90-1151(+)
MQIHAFILSGPLRRLDRREGLDGNIPVRERNAAQPVPVGILPQRASLVHALAVGVRSPVGHVDDARPAQLLALAVGPSREGLVDVDVVIDQYLPDVAPAGRREGPHGLVLAALVLNDGDGDGIAISAPGGVSGAQLLQLVLASPEEDQVDLPHRLVQRGKGRHDRVEGCPDETYRCSLLATFEHRTQLAQLIVGGHLAGQVGRTGRFQSPHIDEAEGQVGAPLDGGGAGKTDAVQPLVGRGVDGFDFLGLGLGLDGGGPGEGVVGEVGEEMRLAVVPLGAAAGADVQDGRVGMVEVANVGWAGLQDLVVLPDEDLADREGVDGPVRRGGRRRLRRRRGGAHANLCAGRLARYL